MIGGRSNAEFARLAGIKESALYPYLSGKSLPGYENIAAIARAGGVSADWLVFGGEAGGPENLPSGQRLIAPASEIHDTFALIPHHEVRASAGTGLVPVEEGEVELLAFRRDWLRRMGVNPRQAALIVATGDSMEPSIPDGAIMLLDTAITEVRNGWICAIVRDGELLVKRIQKKLDGSVLLISDNERYQAEEIGEDRLHQLHIAGRVRWVGRAV
ncbi:MAG: helix-turn-helix domain-containing protein [Defluviimonas sp.]|nr:helix-turn-helix domain-containing protein [Rhodobiaceae bacterium]MCC0065413.1 helix-turn-helix domain-containing protein [Defluviimonas sp.]